MPLAQASLRELHSIYVTTGNQSPRQWRQLIKSYLSSGFLKEALILYAKSLPRRIEQPILPLILKACGSLSSLPLGKCFHGESLKVGVASELLVSTTFVSMYSKCGVVGDARKLFDEMPQRSVVTYNAMVGGYSMNGDMVSALDLFEEMTERTPVSWAVMIDGFARSRDMVSARRLFDRTAGGMRTVVTWTVMVHGYALNGEMDAAREVFEQMPRKSFFVWSVMVNGYFKKGEACEARAMFDRIPKRNLVNWNTLIAGYTQTGHCEEALGAFRQMQEHGFEPDEFTIASVLSACSQLGSLERGRKIHELIKQKKINRNHFVLNGLVDMYAKCGDLQKARQIFDGMHRRNTVCWNSMISGLASHGRSEEALELFEKMEETGGKPDNVTFLVILSACTHGGFVERGLEMFEKIEKHGIVAGVEHYGCLVDLLGRAGRLSEAYKVIKSMPVKPNETVWGALLGACRIHGDREVADRAMSDLSSNAESRNDAKYVVLSNICAASEKWEEAEKMWRVKTENDVRKVPGCSSLSVGNIEHTFHAGAFAESKVCELC